MDLEAQVKNTSAQVTFSTVLPVAGKSAAIDV